MEVFSLVLERQIEKDRSFQYHFRCRSLKLVHISFADDLLVMCHGDKSSVMLIKRTIDEFSGCSRLIPNNSKSTVFFGSLDDNEKSEILKVLPFSTGTLPGRLQLIAVVLESIHVYWASVFLIPITIIKDINKMLKWFLWNQGESANGKAKVAWKSICKPKDQGGLGLKNLQIWNQALLAKQVWNIASKNDTLWVKWVHSVKLRGKSIWEMSVDVNDNTISHRDLYDARLNGDMKVSDMVNRGQWNWPSEWYDKFPAITNLSVPNINEGNDKLVWRDRFGKNLEFSVSIVNYEMNEQSSVVSWWKLIWFSECIPKTSFITWLAIQNRLSTQDKFKKWGDCAVNRCSLCCNDSEDIDHLFFKCEFSKELWVKVCSIINIQADNMNLNVCLQVLIDAGVSNNIKSIVKRPVFSASIYTIWQERNGRNFRGTKRNCDEVFRYMEGLIKNRLFGLKVKNSRAVKDIEEQWEVSLSKVSYIVKGKWLGWAEHVKGNRELVKDDASWSFQCSAKGG
ncbi:RNA-directed DNA polymerase, eukaryota, reverse transcriptase zinc-binding domain protein [Tanacetum coccineum]